MTWASCARCSVGREPGAQVLDHPAVDGTDQQTAAQPAVGNQLLTVFGADQLQRLVDRRLALYAQQQAVRAVIQAWQAEQKLRVGLAALTE